MSDAKHVYLMLNICLYLGSEKKWSELLEEKSPVVCAFLFLWETSSAKYYFGCIYHRRCH